MPCSGERLLRQDSLQKYRQCATCKSECAERCMCCKYAPSSGSVACVANMHHRRCMSRCADVLFCLLCSYLPYETDHAAILCSLEWARLCHFFSSHEMSSHFRRLDDFVLTSSQRTVAREIRTRSVDRLAEEETSLSLQPRLSGSEGAIRCRERNEYVNRLEGWSSFASDALPTVPQLEQQKEARAAGTG